MLKRKQDVDKHITSILARKRDEKERQAQGFQIARLYYDIKEYTTAKRYLSGFLFVRENVPTAHQLMGEINEALGEREEAIENYKRALNLGSFGSSNKQLVLKICELYCELGTDVERMKYWCDQCEKFYPKSDVLFKLKTQIAEVSTDQTVDNSTDVENLVVSELINRPTDLKLRIKLLTMYLDSDRYEEAYDNAIGADLTTAFVDRLPWFEFMETVFKIYGEKFPDSKTDLVYNQHLLHVRRNITYLSLGGREVDDCVRSIERFDRQLKVATTLVCHEEEWLALLQEMKGQLFFLAGLVLLKRAQIGTVEWQEVSQLSGACFLASRSINPLDCQSPWFVRSPQGRAKFNNWWYLQSYDRLSQVGHMLQQLSQNDVAEWSRRLRQSVMTAKGHQRVFAVLFGRDDLKGAGDVSYFYQSTEMVDSADKLEPLTEGLMIDIDRVAYQVHLNSLPHLVWLCLQRYNHEMNTQPNYHFNILENIQFSTKNIDTGAAESLCQLDTLVFLLATVQCAASAVGEKFTVYEDKKGRPALLPVCLSRPLCTPDQEEWWTATYKFCTNSVKDDFSRLRRVLVRGLETVRLVGPHGVSVLMITHIARSLDARAKSLRQAEHGCRCPLNDLIALESRAAFYWEKAKVALQKLQRNHQSPVPKNRLFKETGDSDVPPRLVDKFLAEATFALALASMKDGQFEAAIQGFDSHRSVWAKFYCAQIYRTLADKESENEDQDADEKRQALVFKARDYLFDVMDLLNGDKAHELNILVSKELDDLEAKIHDLELSNVRGSIFYTPSKSPAPLRSVSRINGIGTSTPRNQQMSSLSHTSNGPAEDESTTDVNSSIREHSVVGEGHNRPRPSPERLDLQIKSLSYGQASLFKMVMDRNEELIMINGKMMEELRDNNNQLKNVLTDNKSLMEQLKNFLAENRDMMKQIKTELSSLKPGLLPTAGAQVSPATPLFVPHMSTPSAPRGPFSGYPPQAPVMPMGYGNYPLNSSAAAQQPGSSPYCPTGLPGMKSSNVGKYRPQSDEEEEEEEDLSNIDEASALYREYLDAEQSSYNQYFTPEAQMLDLTHSARSGIEGHPPLPVPSFQPRMNIPAGYFASALRGQTLQYASQAPGQVRPTTPGPGFFSTPPAASLGTAGIMTPAAVRMPPVHSTTAPLFVVATPSAQTDSAQSPVLLASLASQRSILTGFTKPEVVAASPSASLASGTSGIQSFFHAKAVLETKKIKGEITVLVDPGSNLATVLMMGETKDILFHHNIHSLKLEPSFQPTHVIWTGFKVGSVDHEKLVVSLENPNLASQLKEAIQKAAALCQPKANPQQVPSTASTKPITFGSIGATSTPAATGAGKPSIFDLPSSKETSKFSFGGLTFSSSPTIAETAAEKERAKAEPSKQLAASSKNDAPKPFAGFSLTTKPNVKLSPQNSPETAKTGSIDTAQSPLTRQRPLGATPKSPGGFGNRQGDGDEERVEEYEPNVDFKPVISLPELAEKKTGEENETEVFMERCRLFRFDPDLKQWKERGIGELKILRSKDQVRFRIVMRRDQILKLCANHFLSPEMKLTPMASSDRAWCYFASDFSEAEIRHEQLAVKFKAADKAKAFQDVFNSCCAQLREDGESSSRAASPQVTTTDFGVGKTTTDASKGTHKPSTEAAASSGPSGSDSRSLSSLFKPKAGSWECSGCYIRNNEDVVKCPACNTVKPGSKPATSATPGSKPGTSATPSLSEMFKPKAGSWECSGCLVRNNEDVVKCPACGTAKPGYKPATSATPSLSEMFKPKAGSWECGGCLVRNNEDVVKCPACGTTKPGAKPDSSTKDKPSSGFLFSGSTSSAPPESGFKFGAAATSSAAPASGGFVFMNNAVTSTTTAAATTTVGGFVFKSPAVTTTAGAESFKFGVAPATTAASVPTSGFVFKAPVVTAANVATVTTTSAVTSTTGFFFKPTASTPPPTASSIFQSPATGTKSGFTIGTSGLSTTSTATTTTSSSSGSFSFGATAFNLSTAGKTGSSTQSTPGSSGLLAKLLTSDDSAADEIAGLKSKPAAGFNFMMPPKSTAPLGGSEAVSATTPSKGFQFSFTKTPPKTQAAPVVPGSPEVDDHGLYINKEGDDSHIHFEPVVNLPAKVEVKTGEEEEDILFEARAKLYRFVGGEWKEKGVGATKILQHKETKKTRILMRRDQILKICCNHFIEPALTLQPMAKSEGKAWVWYAMDFSEDEGKMEQLAIRFRTADIAAEFQKVFDQCRDGVGAVAHTAEPPLHQGQGDVAAAKKELFKETLSATDSSSDDNEVIFVGEDTPTEDQLARARKYLLPDTFYLYENKPPCPGCIGCEDEGVPSSKPAASKPAAGKVQPKEVAKEAARESTKVKEVAAQDKPVVLGASSNLPDFASLTSDGPADKQSGGFLFGATSNLDFSSLAETGIANDFTWNKAGSSTPFKFAGAGQKLFGHAVGGGDEAEGDESGVVPSDDIHFEPVIALPDLVKVKTGEEDWTSLFCHRAKLYKFDKQLSQWKERGIGDIKILSHNAKTMYRVLQRREQILKVSCNHLISTDMELKQMATSETSWCWVANDLTDAEPSVEQFAVKFKAKETAVEFKSVFEDCQEKLKLASSERSEQEPSRTSSSYSSPGQFQHSTSIEDAIFSQIIPTSYLQTDIHKKQTESVADATVNDTIVESSYHKLGDRGNIYHTKMLDVAGIDTMSASTFTPLGGKEVRPQGGKEVHPQSGKEVHPQGGKEVRPQSGKEVHPQSGKEVHPQSGKEVHPQSGKEVHPQSGKEVRPQSGKEVHPQSGKEVHPQSGKEVRPHGTPLGGMEVHPPGLTSTSVTPLGDKGNIYHTKMLDIAGIDTMSASTCTPLGKEVHPHSTPVGGKAHPHSTPVGGKEAHPHSTPVGGKAHPHSTPVGGKEAHPHSTPVGGKAHPHITPVGGKEAHPHSTPVGGKEAHPHSTPVGGKEAHLHSTPVGGKEVHSHSAPVGGKEVHLHGGKEVKPSGLTSTSVTPLGDRGNIYHTKMLDIAGIDTMSASTCTPLGKEVHPQGGKEVLPRGGKEVHPQGGKEVLPQGGKEVHPQSGKEVSPQIGKEVRPQSGKEVHPQSGKEVLPQSGKEVHPQSGKEVSPQIGKEVRPQSGKEVHPQGGKEGHPQSGKEVHPQSGKEVHPHGLTSTFVTPLGDKGNIYHTKMLDIVGIDTMSASTCTPLGKEVHPQGWKEVHPHSTPVGGKEVHSHSTLVGGKEAHPHSTPVGGKEVHSHSTPIGGKEVHLHSTPVGGKEAHPHSTPRGGKEVHPPGLTSTSVTPLGDKGNIYHTKMLDIAGIDIMSASICAPLGKEVHPQSGKEVRPQSGKEVRPQSGKEVHPQSGKEVRPQSGKEVHPQGGKEVHPQSGKEVHPQSGKEVHPQSGKEVHPQSGKEVHPHITPLGGKEVHPQGGKEVRPHGTPLGGKEVHPPGLTSTSVTPLGDKGNIYHTKMLDIAGIDTMSASTCSPLYTAASKPDTTHAIRSPEASNPGHEIPQDDIFQAMRILAQNMNLEASAGAGEHQPHQYDAAELMQDTGSLALTAEQLKPAQREEPPQEYTEHHQQQQQQQHAESTYEDEEEEEGEDDEDYEEEEENDEVLYEKRVTLCVKEDEQWKKLGTGNLQVTFNEDLNGNSIIFIGDDGERKCNHVICQENAVTLNQRNCEWHPIDYATDEPSRKHFMATFSSAVSAEEFATIFKEGQRLALDSELSEIIPSEMDAPVVYSGGESGHTG